MEILKHSLELVGKRIWLFVAGFTVLVAALFSFTFSYPISFKVSQCVQKEEQYQLHDTTYRLKSIVEKSGGASVRFCIRETYRTVKTNLVEK